MNILFVDDSKLFLKYAKDLLVKHNIEYKTFTCLTGKEALEISQKIFFDVIVLDIFLPDIDGLEVLKRIRKDNSETQIIMVTGWKDTAGLKKAFALGANDYILKPFEETEFIARLTAAIRTREIEEQRKKAEAALRESEAKLRKITDNMLDMISQTDSEGIFVYVSPSYKSVLGYEPNFLLGKHIFELVHPEDVERMVEAFLDGIKNASQRRDEYRTRHAEGYYLWVESVGNPIFEKGKVTGMIFGSRDITERIRMERELEKQKKYFEALFVNSTDAIALFDREYKVIDVNARFVELFGYYPEEIKRKNLAELLAEKEKFAEACQLSARIFQGESVEVESTRKNKEGVIVEVMVKGIPISIDDEVVGGYEIFVDITERKQYEAQLKYLSMHDALTGLYNRAYFEEEMERLDGGREYPVSIILADIDGLKLVNDALGHDEGDRLIRGCAEVLKRSIRANDVAARIGGDEFAVILPRTEEKAARGIVSRIRSNLADYLKEKPDLLLSLSLGRSTCHSPSQPLALAYKEADHNMYKDKLSRGCHSREKIKRTLENISSGENLRGEKKNGFTYKPMASGEQN